MGLRAPVETAPSFSTGKPSRLAYCDPVAGNQARDKKDNTMKTTANDGTVYRVFAGPNGHYVAAEDRTGTHYQPNGGGNGWWTPEQKKEALADAVLAHNSEVTVG